MKSIWTCVNIQIINNLKIVDTLSNHMCCTYIAQSNIYDRLTMLDTREPTSTVFNRVRVETVRGKIDAVPLNVTPRTGNRKRAVIHLDRLYFASIKLDLGASGVFQSGILLARLNFVRHRDEVPLIRRVPSILYSVLRSKLAVAHNVLALILTKLYSIYNFSYRVGECYGRGLL